MFQTEFYNVIEKVNSSRQSRLQCAQLVKNDVHLFPYLINILFEEDKTMSCHAAWVLEFVCADHLHVILPYLDTFTKNIPQLQLESAIRPVSKVCQFLAQTYNSDISTYKTQLNPEFIDRMVETCFDWMINDHKVAAKVYAMETLFLFGHERPWIHDDLKHLLEHDFSTQSAAFKSRSKHILLRMKKIPKFRI